jgi:hypothetical protein
VAASPGSTATVSSSRTSALTWWPQRGGTSFRSSLLSWRRAATGSRDSFLVADRADPDSCAEVAVVVRACVRQLPVGDKDGGRRGAARRDRGEMWTRLFLPWPKGGGAGILSQDTEAVASGSRDVPPCCLYRRMTSSTTTPAQA